MLSKSSHINSKHISSCFCRHWKFAIMYFSYLVLDNKSYNQWNQIYLLSLVPLIIRTSKYEKSTKPIFVESFEIKYFPRGRNFLSVEIKITDNSQKLWILLYLSVFWFNFYDFNDNWLYGYPTFFFFVSHSATWNN